MVTKAVETEYMRVVSVGKDKFLEIRRKLGTPRPSSSGKTRVVDCTGGFTRIPDSDVSVNLTATVPLA